MRGPRALKPWPGALYQCQSCNSHYGGNAGPTRCPFCGSPHVKWLNYETMRHATRKQSAKAVGARRLQGQA